MTARTYDDDYVSEILGSVPKGLTEEKFLDQCGRDIAAGYRREVDEAWRRYSEETH